MRRAAIALAVVMVFVGARTRAVRPPALPKPLSITRSFLVTDKSIVAPLTLTRVLSKLIERSGVTGLTPDQLIRQMFDTQNPAPGLVDPNGPHCNDQFTNGLPSFNGFPRRCPAPEGTLAATQTLASEFFTLGLANRFDQAPADGANCGQYRMVFAHRDKDTIANELVRRHLIFEAVLPNPNPSMGLAACRPVAQFWANLSSIDSMDERRTRLEQFFFEGIPGFVPVIDQPNLAGAGGIRTFQQALDPVTNANARFYQFRLAKQCADGACTLRFVPDVLENTPFGLLFDARDESELARSLRDEFVAQIPTLVIEDVNLINMRISSRYLMAESNPNNDSAIRFFENAVIAADKSPQGTAFRARMQQELQRAGSNIRTDQLLKRAEELTCAGCHGFNGAVDFGGQVKLVVGFQGNQMVSEDILADGEDGPKSRFGIDPIIEKQFAPHRLMITEEFLKNGTPPVHSQ